MGFVQSLASKTFKNEGVTPIMQVFAIKTSYKDGAPGHERVKKTSLSMIDGDGNRICARLATHLTEAGRSLEQGSLLRLDLFNEVYYRVNSNTALMPAILILRYTLLGCSELIVKPGQILTPAVSCL